MLAYGSLTILKSDITHLFRRSATLCLIGDQTQKVAIMSIRWQDWTVVFLGAWLAMSPWQLEFTLNHPATANACGVGMVLVLFNVMSVARLMELGQEIVNIMAGFWLILSPYSLNFSESRSLTLDAMGVGIAVVCLAFWQIFDAVRLVRK